MVSMLTMLVRQERRKGRERCRGEDGKQIRGRKKILMREKERERDNEMDRYKEREGEIERDRQRHKEREKETGRQEKERESHGDNRETEIDRLV